MKKIRPIEDWILWKCFAALMRIILIICSVLLICIVGIAVFERYVLGSALFGSDELIALFAIWLYWIGGVCGSYEGSHISADLTNLIIKSTKLKRIVKICVNAVTTLITGVFAWWSVADYAMWNIQAGTVTTGLRIPYFAGNVAITIGFCLMCFYSFYHFVRSIYPRKIEGCQLAGEER